MATSRLSQEILVYATAAEYAADVVAGRVLARHQQAFLSYAAAGQPQFLRGTGVALTTDPADSTDIVQVSGASGVAGGGYRKTQITGANQKFTYAAHNRSIVHVEQGASLLAVPMVALDWQASGAFLETDFYIINNTNATLTFNVDGTFAGLLELGGDEQITGFALPAGYLAHVFTDADGFVQITLSGEAVTQAELNLKQDTADRVAIMTGNIADDTKYPSAKLVFDHVVARRGAIGANITASITLTAWDAIHAIDASAGAIIITLPSVASQDGELTFSRIDNSANVVAVQSAAGQTFQGVPTGTTHITLRPTGSLRVRAVAAGPARIDWAMPDSASRLWLPTDLASILGFYDALSITGLVEGNDVTTWNDSSAAGRNVSQATAANKPIYRATGLNNLPSVETKGSSTLMDSAAFVVPDTATFVVLLRATNPLFTADSRIGGFAGGGSLNWRYTSGNSNLIHTNVLHMPSADTAPVAGAIELRSVSYDDTPTTGNLKYYLNGAANGVKDYAGDVATPTVAMRLFNEGTTQGHTGLRISAFMAATGVLSDLNRERVEAYMAWRYGIQATNLNAAHTFRNVPPLQAVVQF